MPQSTPPDRSRPQFFSLQSARVAAACTGLAAALAPALALAECPDPGSALRWSYPANGSVEVPTDADLFFTGDVFGKPSLNGEPLQQISGNAYDLGELEPQTTYEVRWGTAIIGFTTGDGPNHRAPEPTEALELTRNPEVSYRCPLVPPQGCFDSFEPTLVALEDDVPKLATLVDVLSCDGSVRSMLWPADCGPPIVASEDRIVCMRTRTTLGVGLSEPTDYVCSVPEGLASVPLSSSCSGPWPPEGVRTVAGPSSEVYVPPPPAVPAPAANEAPPSSVDAPAPSDDGAAYDPGGCALGPQSPHTGGAAALFATLALASILRRRARG